LDADLARIYGVPTKRLNEQVKRNVDRFPSDFVFQLTQAEFGSLRSQIATLNAGANLKSQIATSKQGRGQHRKFLPFAFTEHGAIMAANVLNSPQATQMSVQRGSASDRGPRTEDRGRKLDLSTTRFAVQGLYVVQALVKMRSAFSDTKALARKLAQLEKELKSRLDIHETAIVEVLQRVMDILDPPPQPEPKRRQIGFHAADDKEKE
jgi:hypothetical protein